MRRITEKLPTLRNSGGENEDVYVEKASEAFDENTPENRLQNKKKKVWLRKKPERALNLLSDFILSLVSFYKIDEDGFIHYMDGTFARVIEISGIDIENYNEDDKEACYGAFGYALSMISGNIKIVIIDKKPAFHSQRLMIKEQLEKTENKYLSYLLERQMMYLKDFENSLRVRTSYIIVYGDTKEKAESGLNPFSLLANTGRGGGGKALNKDETIAFLRLLHNFGE